MSFSLAIAVFVVLFALIALVVRGTAGHGKMGINLAPTNCARCHAPLPVFRMPTSVNQALWGGWTCANCGCEMDRWGKEIHKPTGTG